MGGGVTDTSFCVPPNLDLMVPSYYPWDLLLGAGGGDIVLIQYEVGTAWAWVTMYGVVALSCFVRDEGAHLPS
eukprot:scaffold3245_cov181-Skeletonema_menzelii.AAC.2